MKCVTASGRRLPFRQMEPSRKWPAVPPGTCGAASQAMCVAQPSLLPARRTSPSAAGFSASSASCSFRSSTQATAKRYRHGGELVSAARRQHMNAGCVQPGGGAPLRTLYTRWCCWERK